MKDIMLNYYKYIALPTCMALILGMPLATPAEDGNAAMSEDRYGNNYKEDARQRETGMGVNDDTKQKFVAAYIDIKKIQGDYTSKLENIDNEKKAQELQKEAQAKMVEVVKNHDMTVREYNQIVSAISSKPELRMEIEKMAQAPAE